MLVLKLRIVKLLLIAADMQGKIMTNNSEPIDFFGLLIEKGDMVVYPVRKGSRMWMVSGLVDELGEGRIKVDVSGRKPAWVTALDRVVIIP